MTRATAAPRHFMALMSNGAMVTLHDVQNETGMRATMRSVGAEVEELDESAIATIEQKLTAMAVNRSKRRR